MFEYHATDKKYAEDNLEIILLDRVNDDKKDKQSFEKYKQKRIYEMVKYCIIAHSYIWDR